MINQCKVSVSTMCIKVFNFIPLLLELILCFSSSESSSVSNAEAASCYIVLDSEAEGLGDTEPLLQVPKLFFVENCIKWLSHFYFTFIMCLWSLLISCFYKLPPTKLGWYGHTSINLERRQEVWNFFELIFWRYPPRENIGRHTYSVVLKFFVERTDFTKSLMSTKKQLNIIVNKKQRTWNFSIELRLVTG